MKATAADLCNVAASRLAAARESRFDDLAKLLGLDIKSDLAATDLSGIEAPQTDFTEADLNDVDFTGAELTGSNFAGATLVGAVFRGSRLDLADFTGADLTGADFTNASLQATTFHDSTLADTIGIESIELSLQEADAATSSSLDDSSLDWMRSTVPSALERPYRSLKLRFDSSMSVLWVRMDHKPVQCLSLSCVAEIQRLFTDLDENPGLVRHLVVSSSVPQVFCYGIDLTLVALSILARDIDALRMYARRCVDLMWWLEGASSRGIHTTVLIQGDAMSAGLELVLPFHMVISERSVTAGFPEIHFNLFPGFGAISLARRRSGSARTKDMVLSGRLLTAEQLYRRSIVDLVVDDDTGELAVETFIRQIDQRLNGRLAAIDADRLSQPLSYELLLETTDLWVKTALKLSTRDIKLMQRLGRAQARKSGQADEAELKTTARAELDEQHTQWGPLFDEDDEAQEPHPVWRTLRT